mgnify:CR=1 FL=1
MNPDDKGSDLRKEGKESALGKDDASDSKRYENDNDSSQKGDGTVLPDFSADFTRTNLPSTNRRMPLRMSSPMSILTITARFTRKMHQETRACSLGMRRKGSGD